MEIFMGLVLTKDLAALKQNAASAKIKIIKLSVLGDYTRILLVGKPETSFYLTFDCKLIPEEQMIAPNYCTVCLAEGTLTKLSANNRGGICYPHREKHNPSRSYEARKKKKPR